MISRHDADSGKRYLKCSRGEGLLPVVTATLLVEPGVINGGDRSTLGLKGGIGVGALFVLGFGCANGPEEGACRA